MTTELLHVHSYIRGYHEYLSIWEPTVDEMYALKRELQNEQDSNAVVIVRQKLRKSRVIPRVTRSGRGKTASKPYSHPNEMMDDYEVIGHVPNLMALWLTKFVKRPTNNGKVTVKGKRVNRGGGYGLEIPCEYTFEGDLFSITWLKNKLIKEEFLAKE